MKLCVTSDCYTKHPIAKENRNITFSLLDSENILSEIQPEWEKVIFDKIVSAIWLLQIMPRMCLTEFCTREVNIKHSNEENLIHSKKSFFVENM